MRSRSTRLFAVLLHLIVVHIPRNNVHNYWNVGIVGVHPTAILLESLELDAKDGLHGLLSKMPHDFRERLLEEPFWLQDDFDGKCLGPSGFSECGDATLWFVRRKSVKRKYGEREKEKKDSNANFFSFFSYVPSKLYETFHKKHEEPPEDWIYTLQLSDKEVISHPIGSDFPAEVVDTHTRKQQDTSDGECLKIDFGSNRGKEKKIKQKQQKSSSIKSSPSTFPLNLDSCKNNKVWNWHVDGNGHLHQHVSPSKSMCIWRNMNTTSALAVHCDKPKEEEEQEVQLRRIGFSLVRYQPTVNLYSNKLSPPESTEESARATDLSQDVTEDIVPSHISTEQTSTSTTEVRHIPHTMTTSESHANTPVHLEVLPMSALLFNPIMIHAHASAALLKKSSPTFLAGTHFMEGSEKGRKLPIKNQGGGINNLSINSRPNPLLQPTDFNSQRTTGPAKTHQQLTAPSTKIQVKNTVRKIPTHPYIASSKNGIWMDPQTDLEYLTDLCSYLGNDRKTFGRHTIMGVGQYTRTVFNIKVYGVALYVTKRDVLADPAFVEFASLTADQLRSNTDFYNYIQSPSAKFDRSLLIKLNMQLGTDTMRQSLEADWKYLTEEHKDILLNSSFKPRLAEERMLKKIKSEENSSNCSCGQIASEEYGADPSCCARGTELVFTWRKTGDLEIRLDGRVIDIFPRPDIASGIFFEYMRADDPMSPDAQQRFADGFPFLLAPLAQVKGISSVGGYNTHPPTESSSSVESSKNKFDGLGDFANMVASQTTGAISWMGSNLNDSFSNAVHALQHVGDSTRQAVHHILHPRDRDTTTVLPPITSIPSSFISYLSNGSIDSNDTNGQEWDGGVKKITPSSRECRRNSRLLDRRYQCSSSSAPTSDIPYTDEIGVILHPTMNFTHKLFFCMVHMYLMLLLIVSLPESHNTKTRLVLKRSSMKGEKKDQQCYEIQNGNYSGRVSLHVNLRPTDKKYRTMPSIEEEDEYHEGKYQETEQSNMKKSLSYYL